MITEDYVSFEIAKLLKEKGFDEMCYLGYNKNGVYVPTNNRPNSQIIQPDFCFICCPTLQMAMKWLREVHNIHIVIKSVIRLYEDTEYYYELYGIKNKSLCISCDIYKGESWNSNEQACEAAIKYCLEHLFE